MDKMPDEVKEHIKMLYEAIEFEKERYKRSIQPYIDQISFYQKCYPQPLVVPIQKIEVL